MATGQQHVDLVILTNSVPSNVPGLIRLNDHNLAREVCEHPSSEQAGDTSAQHAGGAQKR
jgi:hypothetical protein